MLSRRERNENKAVEQLTKRIWRWHDDTGATSYLVLGRDRACMIDCGTGRTPVLPRIRAVTSLPAELLLTHAHPDHCGAAHEFDRVWLHREDAARLNETEKAFASFGVPPIPKERLCPFDERMSFDLGDRAIRVIPLPGHTAGSVLFIDDAEKAVFSGDAVGSGDIVLMAIPLVLEMPVYRRALAEAADALEPCGDYIWYTGHYHQAWRPGLPGYNPVTLQTVRDMITLCDGLMAGNIPSVPVSEPLAPGGIARRAAYGKAGIIF